MLRLGHIEKALAAVLNIEPAEMGAFRARLRHLRNIGLPRLPKPGSGEAIAYTQKHALEMLVALELERIGQAPKIAAQLTESIVRNVWGRFDGADLYIAIGRFDEPEQYMILRGAAIFSTFIQKKAPNVFSVINVSACVRLLDAALGQVLATD
jgi:hypothetical protein